MFASVSQSRHDHRVRLLLDAAAANGLACPPLAAETRRRLESLLTVGAIVGNPLDSGFAALTSQDTYVQCVEAMLAWFACVELGAIAVTTNTRSAAAEM